MVELGKFVEEEIEEEEEEEEEEEVNCERLRGGIGDGRNEDDNDE